jgi:cation diffusion facilitator family transporter
MAGSGHGSKKVVYAALIGNGSIAILKFIVAFLTGSSAILAEAFHSVADTGNQALLLFGMKRSQRPPDEKHPFGYGKTQYFWSFVVANMLFMVGAVAAVFEGFNKIRHPHPLERIHLIYIVLGISAIIESVSFGIAVREFLRQKTNKTVWGEIKGSKDSNLIVVLLEDSAALVGLLIALAGTLLVQVTGITILDGVASILIGVVLAFVAVFLANEVRKLLIGESASEENLSLIRKTVESFPEVRFIGEISTMHMGPDDILLAIDVDFQSDIVAGEIEKVIDRMEQEIREKVPEVKQIFIEADDVEGYQATVKKKKDLTE